MTKKVFNLNNTIPHSVRLVNPKLEHSVHKHHKIENKIIHGHPVKHESRLH
jgi:hypothetical protein